MSDSLQSLQDRYAPRNQCFGCGPLNAQGLRIKSRAVVEATLEADGKVTATCRGTFVVVKEGHPAFHRW
jgi:hypothetical protein